ncbi:MAG: DUF5127 domain-containing protein, partial [Chitinophagaceae bacterium]
MRTPNKLTVFSLILCLFTFQFSQAQQRVAPSYPLITHNPNFSIWSNTDDLTGSTTTHWTGAEHSLLGLLNVDGNTYRFLGKEETRYKTVLSASDEAPYTVTYTETKPADNWESPRFAATGWKSGPAAIGDDAKTAKTLWKSSAIWVRRSFNITNPASINELFLKLNHDDNIVVYLNGERVYENKGWTNRFHYFPVDKKKLKAGQNVIAIQLANTAGGRYLDFGLVDKPKSANGATLVAEQKSVTVEATQTVYQFKAGGIDLAVTFTSPLLLKDLNLLARPVSYISYAAVANDGRNHSVKLFLGASSSIAVYQPSQTVSAKKYATDKISVMKVGTVEQPVL